MLAQFHSLIFNFLIGYRYELYCASKAARTTQCTVFCAISKEDAWSLNEKRSDPDALQGETESNGTASNNDQIGNSLVPYTREIFDALLLRYEEPNANSRWDAPLFTVIPEMKLNLDEIYSALYEKKPPPPNQATQNVSICNMYDLIIFRKVVGARSWCWPKLLSFELRFT